MNFTQCTVFGRSKLMISNTASYVIYLAIGIIVVFAVMSNIAILIAMVKSLCERQTKGVMDNNISKLCLTSYVVVEIVLAVFLMPITLIETANSGNWTLGQYVCIGKEMVNNLACIMSVLHILIMALDRYLAVCHPLFYRMLTLRHGCITIGLSWIFIASLVIVLQFSGMLGDCLEFNQTCIQIYRYTDFIAFFIFIFLVPLMLIVMLYVLILREVKLFHQRTARFTCKPSQNKEQLTTDLELKHSIHKLDLNDKESISHDASVDRSSTASLKNDSGEPSHYSTAEITDITVRTRCKDTDKHNLNTSNLKAYRSVGCIIFATYACWLPLGVFLIIYTVADLPITTQDVLILQWITYMNAAINPIIYCFNRSSRAAIKSLICSFRKIVGL